MAPPLLSTDQVPDAAGYFVTHPARPVAQGAKQAALTTSTPMRWPVLQQTPGSLTWRPPSGPLHHPFWHTQHAFHARQGELPTGGQSSHGPAAWPGTGAPYSGVRSASTPAPPPTLILKRPPTYGSGNVAVNPGTSTGGSRADSLCYSPSTPDPCFAHMEVSSPQKGHSNVMAASLWTGAPYWGACPLSSRAGTSQPCIAARRRCRIAPLQPHLGHLRRPQWSHHIPFEHRGTITTMHGQRIHHHAQAARPHPHNHHMGNTSGRRFCQGPPLKHFTSAPGLCAK